MRNGDLGKAYERGDVIVRQGEAGRCMFVIQEGEVEVIRYQDGKAVQLAVLGRGEIFGEIALFGDEKRTATVRALGHARILTVDKKIFLQRIQEDRSLSIRIFQSMASRIKHMNAELAAWKSPIFESPSDSVLGAMQPAYYH